MLPYHVCNSTKAGLYYHKLSSRIYIDKANKKDHAGVK